MHRRTIIKLAAGAVGAVAGGMGASAWGQASPPREDIRTFAQDPAKLAALRRAFAALRARPLGDKVGWFNYAAIHGVPADDPDAASLPTTVRTYWNQCHRDRSLFFIWHRAFLYALETNLRRLSGSDSLRLPYWDWYEDPVLPAVFRQEFVDAGRTQRNPLYDPRRDPAVQAGSPVWSARSSGALDLRDFTSFQSRLSESEHGDIHLGVAGGPRRPNMGSTLTAGRDPIFWLHHCNIDRLLVAWQIRHGLPAPNQAVSFDRENFKFPIEAADDFLPRAATVDMNSQAPFGVAYDTLAAPFTGSAPQPVFRPPVARRVQPAARPMSRSFMALSAPATVAVPAQGISLEFALPRPSDRRVSAFFNAPLAGSPGAASPLAGPRAAGAPPLASATRVVVVLQGVRLADAPEGLAGYDVFVNLPDGRTGDPTRFKVGAISLFNLTDGGMDAHAGMTGPDGAPHVMPAMDASSYRFTADTQAAPGGLTSNVVVSLVPRFTPRADTATRAPGIRVDDIRVEVSAAPAE